MSLVVAARSPIERILDYARTREWNEVPFLSSAGNTYNRDYFGEDEQGSQWPMMNVFVKKGGTVHHSWTRLPNSRPMPEVSAFWQGR